MSLKKNQKIESPPEIKHGILDEIINDVAKSKDVKFKSEAVPPTLNAQVSERIYREILAKMAIRRVEVESDRVPRTNPTYPTIDNKPRTKHISATIINGIAELLMEVDENIEIEASFGLFIKNFSPGIKSASDFLSLKSALDASNFESQVISDTVEIKNDVRRIYTQSTERWETKNRMSQKYIEIYDLGVRISKSIENKTEKIADWKPSLKRVRERTRYTSKKSNMFAIELTKVRETSINWNNDMPTEGKTYIKSEVEIELINTKRITDKDKALSVAKKLADTIETVYRASVRNQLNVWADNDIDSDPLMFTTHERALIAHSHNSLFVKENYNENNKYILYDKNYWNKPINIKLGNFLTDDFYLLNAQAAVKHNGKRFFMFLNNGICHLIWPPYTIVNFGTYNAPLNMTYLDGELKTKTNKDGAIVEYIYYVFDVLFYKNTDLRSQMFEKRFEKAAECINAIKPFYGEIKAQTYFKIGTVYDRIKSAYDAYSIAVKTDQDAADGIIIQSPFEYYAGINKTHINLMTFKWKPHSHLTIDFKISRVPKNFKSPKINKHNINRAFFLKVKDGDLLKPFFTRKFIEYDGIMILSEKQMKFWSIEDQIVECRWNKQSSQFEPIRIRDDKLHPNKLDTANDVWFDIHNPIKITTITGEDLILMRKFHNRIKMNMLSKYVKEGSTILDIGSGRGGDFDKWKNNKFKRVYTVEPSLNENNTDTFSKSVRDEFHKRLNSQSDLPDIKLIKYGIQDTKQVLSVVKKDKVDAVVSFFSLTFLSESEEKFDAFLKTIDSVVPKGSKFIGIVMDGQRVHDLLQKSANIMLSTTDELNTRFKSLKSKEINYDLDIENDPNYILNEILARSNDDYIPFEDGNALTFETKAFNITQSGEYGFDMEDPFSNEITITINDKTSMVGYKEWLFNYEHFKKSLVNLGFKEIETYFLDRDQATHLPKDGFIFSSLNRVFVFERTKK